MLSKKKISMQKIADELKISKVTVSKALNGKEGVGEELKKRIFDIAEKNNYMLPSYGHRKVKKIGVIINDRFISLANEGIHYMSMYEEIMAELRKLSCICVLLTPHSKTIESDFRVLFKNNVFDGIILLGILDKDVRKRIEMVNIPKVYVDIYDESYFSNSVVMESIYSTYELTKYLMSMGHRDIGFIGTVGATTSITDRYLGYIRALKEGDIPINEQWILDDRTKEGKAKDIMLPKKMPTAFVSNCDETSIRLIKVLNEAGLKVPDDVSIVSFDNDIYSKISIPKLTTVAIDLKSIGRVTANKMVQAIENINEQSIQSFTKVHRIQGKIIYRDSVKNISLI